MVISIVSLSLVWVAVARLKISFLIEQKLLDPMFIGLKPNLAPFTFFVNHEIGVVSVIFLMLFYIKIVER